MAGNIGFVFENGIPPNSNGNHRHAAYPYYNHHVTSYSPLQPFYNAAVQHSPPPPTYSHNLYLTSRYPDMRGGQAYHMGGEASYPPLNYPTLHNSGQEHVMREPCSSVESHGQRQQTGGGIPGGKLGVIGGAAVAGVGTSLAMQLLPKKLKKNKLVKYGLPLAGAGAAGFKLNQMNNSGKHN